jgi:hypothetical protein
MRLVAAAVLVGLVAIAAAIAWAGREKPGSDYNGYEKVVEAYLTDATPGSVITKQTVRHLHGPFYDDRWVLRTGR